MKISITSIASVSSAGHESDAILAAYRSGLPTFDRLTVKNGDVAVAALQKSAREQIDAIRSESRYAHLDDSVLFAIFAARTAVAAAGWDRDGSYGINIGSSRGATGRFEKYHTDFLESGAVGTLASPTTTLGNIASWVAQDLQTDGPEISHSITCSTALHAMMNGVAWLRAGMADKFIVGGSEASLTPFTVAQMQAMKIYSRDTEGFCCRALDLGKKQNSMVLGEGAAVCCLETGELPNALAIIEGIGYATEILQHSTSISAEAECFKKSMSMALGRTAPNDVDAIVMHAPGTRAGDLAEYNAIQSVFGDNMPQLTTTKWKTGHTLGASGMLGVEMAIFMLKHNDFLGIPYIDQSRPRRTMRKILINAVGFGGNAVSILVGNPDQQNF